MQGFRASAHGHDEDGAENGGLRAGDRVEMLANPPSPRMIRRHWAR
jgi:hypothetical protein